MRAIALPRFAPCILHGGRPSARTDARFSPLSIVFGYRHSLDFLARQDALDTGALDAGIATNLERSEPSVEDRAALAGADLIISTGCFGYVTHTSLERILDAAGDSSPWMAHFVLRMFDFDEAGRMLARHGYVTEKANGLFRQRRFATPEESEHVLANLVALGIDPAGVEATGWYHAELFIARPKADAEMMSLERLLGEAGEKVQ